MHSKRKFVRTKEFEQADEKREQIWLKSLEVIGYGCKIGRNNELALFLDKGKHLIPWNGTDTTRMVDTYDARNLLDNEKQFARSTTKKRKFETVEEKKEEKMCQLERFKDLFDNPPINLSGAEMQRLEAEQQKEKEAEEKRAQEEGKIRNFPVRRWNYYYLADMAKTHILTRL